MGTRSLVKFKDGKSTILCLYSQYDGYPAGMGKDLVDLLKSSTIVNGFGGKDVAPKQFNGIGCLAAYVTGVLKDGKIGNVYVYPPNASDCGEEYVYTVSAGKDNQICLKVQGVGSATGHNRTLYSGPIAEYTPTDD